MKFCFVILHYKTAQDTIECVESIMKQNTFSDIVIVDNASDNGSIELIENKYGSRKNIKIIKNKKNLGFADGNNIGYRYAKNILKADFIAVSNNDIVVESKDFAEKMIDIYDREGYYIAGPDIESLIDHKHQNPMKNRRISKKKAIKEIWRYRGLLFLSKLGVYDFLKKSKDNKSERKSENKTYDKMQKNIKLHGAFMVFSPDFIKKEDVAFRRGTFLYMEETILYEYCLKNHYKTLFTPDVKVYHKEDSSTNALFKATKQKREFVFENMIKSLKVYIRTIS